VSYAVGLPSRGRFVPAPKLLDAGLFPFVVGDLYKVVLAALALPLSRCGVVAQRG